MNPEARIFFAVILRCETNAEPLDGFPPMNGGLVL